MSKPSTSIYYNVQYVYPDSCLWHSFSATAIEAADFVDFTPAPKEPWRRGRPQRRG